MAEKQSFWTVFNAVAGGTAAIVTAITGLYLAFRHEAAPSATAGVAPVVSAMSDSENGTTYDRTPWVGIELRQNEKPVRLRSVNSSWEKFEATLTSGAFELVLSRRETDASIGILAWHDDSIFQCVKNDELRLPGTGIAGAQFAVPILYLNKEGFNYYDSDRLKRLSDHSYSIFVSTIGSGELELPLPRFAGPIYMIVFRVPREKMTVAKGDFELITLRR